MTEYEELVTLLRKWRFAPLGDASVLGEEGRRIGDRLHELRAKLGDETWTRASKEVGWDK